jgi:hypothetical protein
MKGNAAGIMITTWSARRTLGGFNLLETSWLNFAPPVGVCHVISTDAA